MRWNSHIFSYIPQKNHKNPETFWPKVHRENLFTQNMGSALSKGVIFVLTSIGQKLMIFLRSS